MKKLILILLLSFHAYAQSVTREGVWIPQSMAEISDLVKMVNNSKSKLEKVLQEIQGKEIVHQRKLLRALIEQVVAESNKKEAELLMRTVLNRALTIDEYLSKIENDQYDVLPRQILMDSVKWAIKLHKNDIEYLSSLEEPNIKYQKPPETHVVYLAAFEVQYAQFLKERAIYANTHAGGVEVLKFTLDQFRGGLNASQLRRSYARPILQATKLYESLQPLPQNPIELINYYVHLKSNIDEVVEEASNVSLKKLLADLRMVAYNCGQNKLGDSFVCVKRGKWARRGNGVVNLDYDFEIQTATNFENAKFDEKQLKDFIKERNDLNDGYVYRLPYSYEWEYAYTAGNQLAEYKDNSLHHPWNLKFEKTPKELISDDYSLYIYQAVGLTEIGENRDKSKILYPAIIDFYDPRKPSKVPMPFKYVYPPFRLVRIKKGPGL